MPYPPEHYEEVRGKIVGSARRLFNRHGFNAVSIDDIMGDAGLTRGSFYTYFESKTDLYAESVTRIVSEKTGQLAGGANGDAQAPLSAAEIIREYLSRGHYEDIDGICPMIALPSDISRTDQRVRQAFETALKLLIEIFEHGMPQNSSEARRRALAVSALCVGGMVLARSIEDLALADELRESAMAIALSLGQWQ